MFNFENTSTTVNGNNSKSPIIKPGIHVVKTTHLEAGLSPNKQTPYIDWFIVDDNSATLYNRYYMNTTITEGKTQSAFDVSAKSFLELTKAILAVDETVAKTKLNEIGKSVDHSEFAKKLSALVSGKRFKIKVVGKEVDGGKGRFIKSEFGSVPFAEPVNGTFLVFDETKNIKRLPAADAKEATEVTDPWA